MHIIISRFACYAYHGVMPQERIVGANFYVSIDAEVEVSDEAMKGDELAGTVSYADIIDVIREEMAIPSKLLENVCYRVGQRLKLDFPRIKTVTVRIDKENPPCGVKVEEIGVRGHY